MLGQRVGQETPVGIDELNDAPIFHHDRIGEEQQFLFHQLGQVVLEIGRIAFRVGSVPVEAIELQPLPDKPFEQTGRYPPIVEHAAHLLFEPLGIAEATLLGCLQQLAIRHAAPEEIRQARGQLVVIERTHGWQIRARGRVVVPEDHETRRHQYGLQRQADRRLKVFALLLRPVEQPVILLEVCGRGGTAKGACGELPKKCRHRLSLGHALRKRALLEPRNVVVQRPLIRRAQLGVVCEQVIQQPLAGAEVFFQQERRDR